MTDMSNDGAATSDDLVRLDAQLNELVEHLRSREPRSDLDSSGWFGPEVRATQFDAALAALDSCSRIFGDNGPILSLTVRSRLAGLTHALLELQEAEKAWRAGLPDRYPDGSPVEEPLSPRQAIALAGAGAPPWITDDWRLALSQTCPYCYAEAGQFCRTSSDWYTQDPHSGRLRKAVTASTRGTQM